MSAVATRFAVATFARVSDPYPVQDALTLPELTAALARFLVKPGLKEEIDDALGQIGRAVESLLAGRPAVGKAGAKLEVVAREARERGADVAAALRARARLLARETRQEAKKSFRLWSPLCFRPGGRRDVADVAHASCLVLDYNDGTPIEEAHALWSGWCHLIHTTWSHTPSHPMFRLVLPLARPVGPEGLRELWRWAEDHVGFPLDPLGAGIARAYTLPVVPDARAARRALAHAGPLFDAAAAGIDVGPAPQGLPGADVLRPGLMRHDPEAAWVEGSADAAPEIGAGHAWREDDARPATQATRRPETRDGFEAVLARLDGIAGQLDRLGRSLVVDELERLASLRAEGALDEAEYRIAKARILG